MKTAVGAPVEQVDVLRGHVIGDLVDKLVDALLLRAVRLRVGVHSSATGVLAQATVLVLGQVVLRERYINSLWSSVDAKERIT